MSTCTICGLTFSARHSYGLCPLCFSKDRAPYWYAYWREGDKLRSAYIGKELQNKTS